MKAIKLCYDDPDLFQTAMTAARCDFITNHFEAFMQMYKTQGSTFWLRFLITFKNHIEEKFCSSKKWLSFLTSHFQFIKVLNFVYISLHKKFIEGSNTAVKKFINNLITLAMNSPSCLNYSCQQWLIYLKSSKQLHNILQNLFGVSEPAEYSGCTAFIFSVYIDFFCTLCSVFEQWYKASDLTEEEHKKIDSKVIYWLPIFDTEQKIKPSCFEKYISDHWTENLQRMLLTDNIHNLFSSHKTTGCCEKFDKEKNIFRLFQFTEKHAVELTKILFNEGDIDDSEESVHTITEVCMKDVCILKPQVMLCTSHKKCFVKICHADSCLEPFVCSGSELCVLTCETKLKNAKKQEKKNGKKQEKFWKSCTINVFPIDKKKCEVSTMAESYDRDIYTFLHVKESFEMDLPLSVLKHTYHQCLAELHNFDLNPRRTECLNRLRKKLSQKHPSNSFQFNVSALRQSFYRESLYENALTRMAKFQKHYCMEQGHDVVKCDSTCFKMLGNTVATSTSNAFGRVILLSKTFITIPYELTCDGKIESNCIDCIVNSENGEKSISHKKADKKKSSKQNYIADCSAQTSNSKKSVSASTDNGASGNIKKETDDADDDIDAILKLIGIGEAEDKLPADDNEMKEENSNKDPVSMSKDDQAVDNFFQLIMPKNSGFYGDEDDFALERELTSSKVSLSENCDTRNLKVCAYCKKKETHKKMFKKCSRCKEENFPVQHYYCSRECLLEDWAESHEAEHLKFNK